MWKWPMNYCTICRIEWKTNKQKTWPALTIGNYNSFDDNYRFFERLIRIYNENIKHNIDCGALHNERIEILLEKKRFSSSKSNSFNFMGCSMSIWPNLWSIAVDYFNGMEFLSFYNACIVFETLKHTHRAAIYAIKYW